MARQGQDQCQARHGARFLGATLSDDVCDLGLRTHAQEVEDPQHAREYDGADSFQVVDLDGDGRPEVCVSQAGRDVRVLGYEDGKLVRRISLDRGMWPRFVTDLTGDALPDFVLTSSFYIGIAGAMLFAVWLGSVETAEAFDINVSFQVLFMIIIGGLGSILGSILGAAFIVVVPVLLTNAPQLFGIHMPIDLQKHIEVMLFGSLIIFFLIVEPNGFARLWQIAKEKLRLWPFPY